MARPFAASCGGPARFRRSTPKISANPIASSRLMRRLRFPKNSVYLESTEDVDNYTEIFDQLRDTALDPSETRTHIARISKELEE
ncbi:Scr1 family TA system antitoxin-like transcriptional regulator [Streptomyces massasporeus]